MKVLILAGGFSTRLRSLGIEQKAAEKVRWNGKIAPLVVHQVEWAQKLADEVVVMVGWKEDYVREAIKGLKVETIRDTIIGGQWWCWKQFYSVYGNIDFVSLNVDDLHVDGVIEYVKKAFGTTAASMIWARRPEGKYTVYKVKNSQIETIEQKVGILGGWIGTGIYTLRGRDIAETPMLGHTYEEQKADFFIERMLKDGKIVGAIKLPTGVWFDAGNLEGMRKIRVV
jgi:NDP-sugar pyrophosphorylase family protein